MWVSKSPTHDDDDDDGDQDILFMLLQLLLLLHNRSQILAALTVSGRDSSGVGGTTGRKKTNKRNRTDETDTHLVLKDFIR